MSTDISARTDWHRVFDSLAGEHDYLVDEIDGTLPRELSGTLYRNGPGKWEVNGSPVGHIFDGDGMLSMFTFDAGTLRYRNRYVRTNHYRAELDGRGFVPRGFGTQRPGGVLANLLRLPSNMANTSVVLHAGELFALWEGGKPHALDPDTLDTRGEHDFDGRLKWLGAFSAHPKLDPVTGELFNFGIDVFPMPTLRCYRVDPDGTLHHLQRIRLPQYVFNHDYALTERHLVFVLQPMVLPTLQAMRFVFGFSSIHHGLRFTPERGTRIVLAPRDGGPPQVTERDTFAYSHVNNAYCDGDDTVVDLVRYPGSTTQDFTDSFVTPTTQFRTVDYAFAGGSLARLRITPSGRTSLEDLCQPSGDFAQHDTRRTGRPHRYGYLAVRTTGSCPSAIMKIDHQTGRSTRHELPADHPVSEPIFVPRNATAAEDDGWLLAVAYDPAQHRSRLLVLDARQPDRAPIAVAHLPHHVPQGFHGTFTTRIAKPAAAAPPLQR